MKSQKGMSIIKLIIVVSILIVLSFVMYIYFSHLAKESKTTDITTNMYTLNTNATEILNSNIHKNEQLVGSRIEPDEKYNLSENEMLYELSDENIEKLGLYIEPSNYLIIYNVNDKKTDIIYTNGIEKDGKILYRLSEIENEEQEIDEKDEENSEENLEESSVQEDVEDVIDE